MAIFSKFSKSKIWGSPPSNFFWVPQDPQILIPKISLIYLFVRNFEVPNSNDHQMAACQSAQNPRVGGTNIILWDTATFLSKKLALQTSTNSDDNDAPDKLAQCQITFFLSLHRSAGLVVANTKMQSELWINDLC